MRRWNCYRSAGPLALAATVSVLACDGSAGRGTLEGDEPYRSGWSVQSHGGLVGSVYVPEAEGTIGEGRSLLIALHGCGQSYQELETYGQWVETAEAHGMVISLPGVPDGGVFFGCWDYYGGSHSRGTGDAADLLGLVESLLAEPSLGIDPDQVYIAGLSSGGGMAMVMGCLAPDVFAGVGIAAGPTVGTTAFEIGSVSTDLPSAAATCESLAGSEAAGFDTQLAAVIAGTMDFTVAQGYADLNAEVFAQLYAEAGDLPPLSTSAVDVGLLPGYEPAGAGVRYDDGVGTRVLRISAEGMGHAWPAGSGPGPETAFVASEGVDFARALADQFSANNRRVEGSGGGEGGGGETGGGETGGGETGGEETGGGDTGGEETGSAETGGEGTGGGATGGEETGGSETSGGDCEPWVDEATALITGHFARFAVYPGGYGVADITYLGLYAIYGLSAPITLYQAPGGDWYHDPANVPGSGCG